MLLDEDDEPHVCYATTSSVVVPFAKRQSVLENELGPAEGVVQIHFACPTKLKLSHEHPNITSRMLAVVQLCYSISALYRTARER